VGIIDYNSTNTNHCVCKWWNVALFSSRQPAVHHHIPRFSVMELEFILKSHKKKNKLRYMKTDVMIHKFY